MWINEGVGVDFRDVALNGKWRVELMVAQGGVSILEETYVHNDHGEAVDLFVVLEQDRWLQDVGFGVARECGEGRLWL